MISLGLAPSTDPSPMTREGTRAMVERFHAMKGLGLSASMPEEGEGGPAVGVGTTTPIPVGPKKLKSHSHLWHSCEICPDGSCVVPIQLEILPAEKKEKRSGYAGLH